MSFPVLSDRVGPTEGVGVEASHDETDQVELRDSSDTLWVWCDPLDDEFGHNVEAPSVLHAIGHRGLSRGGFFVRLVPVQQVGEPRSDVGKAGYLESWQAGPSIPTSWQVKLSQWWRGKLG